ncbi:putative sporulation protein YtxC [Falsibacillus albus]|uniref:Sporulation protein n=1 Tax=Falsibacillus albus TaxID=2478915 RepID=A0A3L7KBD4_9BACI|nr:putative sporulation protein YtxC [Falsibacillus albus]RLQ97982.1 sporulation protein [Falsibacillus albus]
MEIIFKQWQDVLKLQHCLAEHAKSSWYYETEFQNQKQFILTIDVDAIDEAHLKRIIKNFLLNQKRGDWIRTILHEQFFYQDDTLQNQIMDIVYEIFSGDRTELTSLLEEADEDAMIEEAAASLFERSGAISFDSFIKFRMKKYMMRLVQYVELAIDEFKMEQEYQTFVQMLRDFLQKKESKMDAIHLVLSGDDQPVFFNSRFEQLTRQQLLEMMDRRLLTNHPVYIDSFTIAPLLSMAPQCIYIYTDERNNGLVRTVQNIFEERVCILKRGTFEEEKNAANGSPAN